MNFKENELMFWLIWFILGALGLIITQVLMLNGDQWDFTKPLINFFFMMLPSIKNKSPSLNKL